MFRKVFVLYPRGLQTGGPEALHQLVDALRGTGQDAFLVPRRGTEAKPRVAAYAKYDAPEASLVEDRADCAVVAPEDALHALRGYRHARRFCWWLSIDNASVFRELFVVRNAWARPSASAAVRLKRRLMVPANDLRRRVTGEIPLLGRIEHLAQSQYAWSFIHSRLGVLPSMLSDYTPLDDFAGRTYPAINDRPRAVAYNPVKSDFVVGELRSGLPDVEFIALQNMTRSGVIDALSSSVVYIDLGNHPGKDRMPREAALCGAVTLVARRGSGALWADVPVDGRFKIRPGSDMVEDAAAAVRDVLRDPGAAWQEQQRFRDVIAQEQDRFRAEVRSVFVEGLLGESSVPA